MESIQDVTGNVHGACTQCGQPRYIVDGNVANAYPGDRVTGMPECPFKCGGTRMLILRIY